MPGSYEVKGGAYGIIRTHKLLTSQKAALGNANNPDVKFSVFVHAEDGGAMFGAWIDANSRNNGYDTGDAIENPIYVIEDFLRRVLGQTDLTIDYVSFDVHGNNTNGTIKDWKFFGSLSDIEDSRDVLERFCAQAKSRLYRDADGAFSIWTYSTAAAVDYTGYDFDTTNHISNLTVSRTPKSDICNTIRINYNLDRGSGKYMKQTFISVKKEYVCLLNEGLDTTEYEINVATGYGSSFAADDYILIDSEVLKVQSIDTDTLTVYNAAAARTAQAQSTSVTHDDMSPVYKIITNSDNGLGTRDQNTTTPDDRESDAMNSAWQYGVTNEFILNCDFISDDTTAQELREHYFDYLCHPRYIIDFDTFLNVSDLKVNNVIEFNSTIMDAYMKLGATSWGSQKFVVTKIEKVDNLNYHVTAEHLSASFV